MFPIFLEELSWKHWNENWNEMHTKFVKFSWKDCYNRFETYMYRFLRKNLSKFMQISFKKYVRKYLLLMITFSIKFDASPGVSKKLTTWTSLASLVWNPDHGPVPSLIGLKKNHWTSLEKFESTFSESRAHTETSSKDADTETAWFVSGFLILLIFSHSCINYGSADFYVLTVFNNSVSASGLRRRLEQGQGSGN